MQNPRSTPSPAASEPCTSGASLLGVRRALEGLVGEDVVGRALASLPRATADELATMTPFSWVRMSTSSQLIDAAAQLSGWDAEKLYDVALRRGAEQSFRTLWKALVNFTTDRAFIARAPLLYAKAHNTGALVAQASAPGRAEARVVGWPAMNDRAVRSVGVNLQVALELAGRRDVRGTWFRTGVGAVYQLRWWVPNVRSFAPARVEPARAGGALSVRLPRSTLGGGPASGPRDDRSARGGPGSVRAAGRPPSAGRPRRGRAGAVARVRLERRRRPPPARPRGRGAGASPRGME
ncbi:MAG TPA: hypothetical protein VFS43_06755 [Polyangiaceae bacterium]|nr:hypothetical protein [Polyangiaceae bacterium]